MKIKKIHSQAKTPTRGSYDSAGHDLYSVEHAIIPPHRSAKLGTGLCMEMEKGTVGLIWERSKLASKFGLQVMGGVVDCDYRGEVMISLYNNSDTPYEVKVGDRMAQIIFQQYIDYDFEDVEQLNDTPRGTNGINSTENRL